LFNSRQPILKISDGSFLLRFLLLS